ncbi:MAG: OmpA family protein [Bacteroidetes bacterium]|nr:OmpA family protein [Bacteroidota bacterium]
MENQSAKPQIHAYSLIRMLGIWCLLSVLVPQQLFAQQAEYELSTPSSKAKKYYLKAEQAFIETNRADAELYLLKSLKADEQFVEAWLLLGDVYGELGKADEAIEAYKKAIDISPDFFPPVYYFLGKLNYKAAAYAESAAYLRKLISYSNIADDIKKGAVDVLSRAEFAANAVNNPVPFNPVNVGPAINSDADEYINAIRLDGGLLLFTRRFALPDEPGSSTFMNERFFYSQDAGGLWMPANELMTNWTIADNMGAMTISADGMKLYYAGCSWPGGLGSCDVYQSDLIAMQWSEPTNLGSWVNSPQWDSQPSVSADGHELFFVSRRNGGLGGSDIWMCRLLPDGRWTRPINLGENINTPGNEMAPFLHPDGKTLYFSSTGLVGLGGADLFVSRRDESGRWSVPKNLGYPINTAADEINIIVDATGKKAYISALKDSGSGRFDIYSFEMPGNISPDPVSYVKAIVADASNGIRLPAAYVITNLETGQVVAEGNCVLPDGSFLAVLPSGNDYGLHVQFKGYLFYSENFALSQHSETTPFVLNIGLQPIRLGAEMVLRNVFFDYNKAEVMASSNDELTKLANFMGENPLLKIELGGHTDSLGSEEHNLQLSMERAEAVKKILIGKGVPGRRLKAIGYGASKPVADNSNEAGRALNRRTTITLIE